MPLWAWEEVPGGGVTLKELKPILDKGTEGQKVAFLGRDPDGQLSRRYKQGSVFTIGWVVKGKSGGYLLGDEKGNAIFVSDYFGAWSYCLYDYEALRSELGWYLSYWTARVKESLERIQRASEETQRLAEELRARRLSSA